MSLVLVVIMLERIGKHFEIKQCGHGLSLTVMVLSGTKGLWRVGVVEDGECWWIDGAL